MNENIIEMKNITKSFYIGTPNQLNILKGIDITVKKGEFVSIVGQSGSGKSTLMNIIGALDRVTSGSYILGGTNIEDISDDGLSEVRNKQIGFVFQTYNLIPRNSVLKNVELPMLYAGIPAKERTERAMYYLEIVGMKDRIKHQPNELSGGQKQRVAIARALATEPNILLADEPTGALDSGTGRIVMDLFHKVHEEQGKTIVFITHNNELAEETERIVTLRDGIIVSDEYNDKFYRRYSDGERICL
ncbi:MAG: ABC transporter ATP-binding protein [Clostridium sp.]|nr:ABC transporter ATP-binding protein [Clostridium sp.]